MKSNLSSKELLYSSGNSDVETWRTRYWIVIPGLGQRLMVQGATPRELLLEACRRDNVELLNDVLHTSSSIDLLNTARDGVGNFCLHVAASYGSCMGPFPCLQTVLTRADEVLDKLLDQEGLEVDPLDRLDGDTPLHKAVRYVNGQNQSEWRGAASIVELLLDAGADPRYVTTNIKRPSL